MADEDAAANYGNFGSLDNQDHQQRNVRRQRTPAVTSRVNHASPEQQRGIQGARQQLSFLDGAEEVTVFCSSS